MDRYEKILCEFQEIERQKAISRLEHPEGGYGFTYRMVDLVRFSFMEALKYYLSEIGEPVPHPDYPKEAPRELDKMSYQYLDHITKEAMLRFHYPDTPLTDFLQGKAGRQQ